MWSVACKNDNSAFLHFQILSAELYFHFISGLYLCNHLKYFSDTLLTIQLVNTQSDSCKNEDSDFLHFLIISPDPYLNYAALGKSGFCGISTLHFLFKFSRGTFCHLLFWHLKGQNRILIHGHLI